MRISMLGSIIPDFDAIGFKFHIPYESLFGHRVFTHSIFFAAILSLIFFGIFFRKDSLGKNGIIKVILVLFISTLLHPILDAMTDGGLGVAFLSPFSNQRFFFPFTPIPVSPIAIGKFASFRGLYVLGMEVLIVWLPMTLIYWIVKFVRGRLWGGK